MARIDIDLEDYLDEVDTRFLIRELNNRKKIGQLKNDLDEILDELEINDFCPPIKTILDQQKRDWVNENWDKIQP